MSVYPLIHSHKKYHHNQISIALLVFYDVSTLHISNFSLSHTLADKKITKSYFVTELLTLQLFLKKIKHRCVMRRHFKSFSLFSLGNTMFIVAILAHTLAHKNITNSVKKQIEIF